MKLTESKLRQIIRSVIREEMVNEANLSNEVLKIKKGDVVVTTQRLDPKQLNFKKSALTWWGSNISSVLNIIAKESSKDGKIFAKGDVMFIASKDGQLNNKGKGVLNGYMGGWIIDDSFSISSWNTTYSYDEYQTQMIILALLNNLAKVIPYSKLDDDKKFEFEAEVVKDRVTTAILKKKRVVYDGMIVTSYRWDGGNIILSGFDIETKNEMPKKIVDDLTKLREFTIDGKKVDSNPF